jgi:hypothetical protein
VPGSFFACDSPDAGPGGLVDQASEVQADRLHRRHEEMLVRPVELEMNLGTEGMERQHRRHGN